MKKEKGQPEDTTNTGPGRDSYQSKSSGQHHQKPKARQDGVNQSGKVNAGDHLWKLEHSEGNDPNK